MCIRIENTWPHGGYHLFRNLTPIKLIQFHLHRSLRAALASAHRHSVHVIHIEYQ